jgi:uncharacterized membrane protein YoaT (DUF817 family)
MAKYFIHNGEQASIIAELPAGYTVLEVTSAERSVAIDSLPNVDVVGVPCIIEELSMYETWSTENKINKWKCIHVEDATTWAELEASKTNKINLDKQAHDDTKAHVEALEE